MIFTKYGIVLNNGQKGVSIFSWKDYEFTIGLFTTQKVTQVIMIKARDRVEYEDVRWNQLLDLSTLNQIEESLGLSVSDTVNKARSKIDKKIKALAGKD